MGKKRTRGAYSSKGQGRSIANGVRLARAEKPQLDRSLNLVAAWKAGKNPVLTVENPNKSERNRPYIKMQANAYWGDPRRKANIYKVKDEE